MQLKKLFTSNSLPAFKRAGFRDLHIVPEQASPNGDFPNVAGNIPNPEVPAALEQAKLNLAYSEIRAPLSGRTGNLLMHVGNLVKANDDKPLVVINQIAPIFVTFGVPERYLSLISQQNSRRKLMVEVAPGKESEETIRGTLAVIDNTVDKNTGTIRLKAVFDNRDASLWPGQFANVVLTMDRQRDRRAASSHNRANCRRQSNGTERPRCR